MKCITCLNDDDRNFKYCYTTDSINRKVYRQFCTVCKSFVGTMVKREIAESCGYDLAYHDGNSDKFKVQQYMKDTFIPAENDHDSTCLGSLEIGYTNISDKFRAYQVICKKCQTVVANTNSAVIKAWHDYYEEGVVSEGMALRLLQMTQSMVCLDEHKPRFSHKIPKLLFEQYNDYMLSSKWQRQRDNRMAIDNNECKLCFSRTNLHVHHITYDNFGNEPMNELITVCKTCHEKIHGHEIN